MKLKRIIAGITACTIVGSTMLTMPISARTITKVEEVTLSDLMNTAKMVADLKDDLTAEKQAEILDRFDTDGSGHISIAELLEVAKRVARIDESDIVNEYGTADSEETTTAETTIETTETTVETSETTETTVETTETTEETTTTTEAVAFNPVIEIDGTEYKDGDTFAAKANKIYEVNATDAENEITVSLTGSKDDEDNDLVRVSENRFETVKDGTLTITVKSADGQQKTITLNIKIAKSLEDADKAKLCISYLYEGEKYYSDAYKKFSNEIGEDVFEEDADKVIIEDPEQYWNEVENYRRYESISGGIIYIGIGGKLEIKGFAIRSQNDDSNDYDYEDFNTNDKITYISTDANKVTIDENGVITGIAHTDTSVEIIVMVNGKEFSRFKVYVGNTKYSIIEITGEKYVLDNLYRTTEDSLYDYYEYELLVEGKYVENVSQGKALSLKDLQNQVGAENVRSISAEEFDGSKREITNIDYIEGVMYYLDTTTSTVYYAITDETGQGQFRIDFGDYNGASGGIILRAEVLDMEQYKKYQAEQVKAEAFTVEFYGKRLATATADGTQYYYGDSSELPYVFIAEGETFSLSDIVKVSGVDDPKITVANSCSDSGDFYDDKPEKKNLDYDPLTKTFTALEITEENSGDANSEIIKLTYTASDGTTRTIEFRVIVMKPVFSLSYDKKDSGKYYCTAKELEHKLSDFSTPLDLTDPYAEPEIPYCKLTVDNKKMFSVTETKNTYGSYDSLSLADGYEPKAGDTATITATASYMGSSAMIFSPNLKVTYTVEVVDALPEISKNINTGNEIFEYPENNKSNQDITFDNIVDIKNLSDDWKVVPYVKKASDNVGYIDEKGNKQNVSDMTVDATGLEIVEGVNKHHSISGIQVASAYKVPADTSITVGFKVFDADGNRVRGNYEDIELSVKGEQESISVTIRGETVTDYGSGANEEMTVYLWENEIFKLSDIVNIKSVSGKTIDDIKITNSDEGKETQNVKYNSLTGEFEVLYLIEENSGNNNIDTLTFSYTTGNNEERKVTVNIITVVAGLKEENSDRTYSRVYDRFLCTLDDIKNGNLPIPTFITSVDKNDRSILDEDIPWDEFLIESDDETKLKVNGKTLTATENLEVGDEVKITYAHKQGYSIHCKIHIVEAVPTVSKKPLSKIGTEIKSTDREPVKFEDVFQISNIPDGWTLYFHITDSDTKYKELLYDCVYNIDSPIDATNIELIKGENGLYSLGNIGFSSYDLLEDGKKYSLTGYVLLCDEKDIIMKEFAPNTFYIQKNNELKVTIGDHTATATDEKTVNMGTVYLAENKTINMEDIVKLTGYYGGGINVTSSDPSIVSVTSDNIKVQAYTDNIAGKSATLTFTSISVGRTVTVDVIIFKPIIEIFMQDNNNIIYKYIGNGEIYDVSDSAKNLKITPISDVSENMFDRNSFKYINGSNMGDILDEDGNLKPGIKNGATQTVEMRDEYGNDYSVTLKYTGA